MSSVTDWLLAGPGWVRYRTRLDLMGLPESDKDIKAARKEMLADPRARALVAELSGWPGSVLTSHKSAGHPVHKLVFLADLGLRQEDSIMGGIIKKVMAHPAETGPFRALVNVPTHFGGTGRDEWAWSLCDAPLLLYALCRFGLRDDKRVRKGIEHLVTLVRGNGWPCAVSPELGKFRGPGRKDDPCPYATLIMLQLLAEVPEFRDSPPARAGAEALLSLWAASKERHPYMFFMGTDFRKLKAPLVWYDVLHVLDVLARLPWLGRDRRLKEMAGAVTAKADKLGRYTPESVWKAWEGWEFGQKREPSRWLTYVALRVRQRVGSRARSGTKGLE
jgi:hypothetical protein